jgi:enolase-phosphatase E1
MNRLHFACEAVVTDIEGTTGSIAFVKDVLFPYADKHMERYVREHEHDELTRESLAEVAQIAGLHAGNQRALIAELRSWMEQDRKDTPLKTLQGAIWESGYRDGSLRGHVYSDAVDSMRAWHAAGVKIYLYSSGSVAAQKLLFAHSVAGDLTPLFSGYFDTTTGPKREPGSYETISREIGTLPNRILFLSDVAAELDAAREAGLRTVQLVRANDGTVQAPGHVAIRSFEELHVEPATHVSEVGGL